MRLLVLLLLLVGVAWGQESLAVGKKVPDFELLNETTSTSGNDVEFYSNDYPTNRPILTIN